jgi:hypothetical protein
LLGCRRHGEHGEDKGDSGGNDQAHISSPLNNDGFQFTCRCG